MLPLFEEGPVADVQPAVGLITREHSASSLFECNINNF
jgi:hypothetical protein